MNKREWLKCTEPEKMLDFLRDRASDRKFLLFAVACARRLLPVRWFKEAGRNLHAVESYADGEASFEEVSERLVDTRVDSPEVTAIQVATGSCDSTNLERVPPYSTALNTADCVLNAFQAQAQSKAHDAESAAAAWDAATVVEQAIQCALVREIFGTPFRRIVLKRSWRTPLALALASAAYENRRLPGGTLDPERLAVLADALEESGCDNAELLDHLRGLGVHVRGCWAVDALLAKSDYS